MINIYRLWAATAAESERVGAGRARQGRNCTQTLWGEIVKCLLISSCSHLVPLLSLRWLVCPDTSFLRLIIFVVFLLLLISWTCLYFSFSSVFSPRVSAWRITPCLRIFSGRATPTTSLLLGPTKVTKQIWLLFPARCSQCIRGQCAVLRGRRRIQNSTCWNCSLCLLQVIGSALPKLRYQSSTMAAFTQGIASILLFVVVLRPAASDLTCRTENGEPVDWYLSQFIFFFKLHFSLLACEDFFLLSGKWRSFVGHVHLSDVRPLTFLLLDHKMRVLAQILDNRFFLVEWWQKWAGQVNIINDSRSNVGPSKHSDVS